MQRRINHIFPIQTCEKQPKKHKEASYTLFTECRSQFICACCTKIIKITKMIRFLLIDAILTDNYGARFAQSHFFTIYM